jgi:ethanolamine ammonia-lyase small subunit
MSTESRITLDPWTALRVHTAARIALGRAGGSLPTHEWLAFKSAHAAARDAVHHAFDIDGCMEQFAGFDLERLVLRSTAHDRTTYLQRPDLGRSLAPASSSELARWMNAEQPVDLVIILSDGLSGAAVERHSCEVLRLLIPRLQAQGIRIAPLVFVPFARVAIEDEIGEILNARIAVILIGERPGLSSPDSLGAYLVYQPRRGRTDAERNCVSNIRPQGL